MVRERLPVLGAIGDLVDFLLRRRPRARPGAPGPEALGRGDRALPGLLAARDAIEDAGDAALRRPRRWSRRCAALAEARGWKAGDLFMAIRVAITGRTATPPLFESMVALGRERTLARLARAASCSRVIGAPGRRTLSTAGALNGPDASDIAGCRPRRRSYAVPKTGR